MTDGTQDWTLHWRNVLVAECRRRDSRAFTGKNKVRFARPTGVGSPAGRVALLNGVMILIDTPRDKVLLAAFPMWTGLTRSAQTDDERTALIGRAEAAAVAAHVEMKKFSGTDGRSERTYMRELDFSERDFLVDGTYTRAAEEQINSFAEDVRTAASAFLADPGDARAASAYVDALSQAFEDRLVREGIKTRVVPPKGAPSTSPRTQQVSSPEESGKCYVATAVYGSYDAPQVMSLRRFRDEELTTSAAGRAFVRLYYALSPSLAKHLGGVSALNRISRRALDMVVRKVEDRQNSSRSRLCNRNR